MEEDLIIRTAKLSRLSLRKEDRADIKSKMNEVMRYVARIRGLSGNIESIPNISGKRNVFREDVVDVKTVLEIKDSIELKSVLDEN